MLNFEIYESLKQILFYSIFLFIQCIKLLVLFATEAILRALLMVHIFNSLSWGLNMFAVFLVSLISFSLRQQARDSLFG